MPCLYENFLNFQTNMLQTEIESLANAACERVGVELVEADLFRAGKRLVLRLFIDCTGGVTVEHCASVSRVLAASLEEQPDLIDGAYTLEVSSPGLDRPLKTTRDFERQLGRKLRVTSEGQKKPQQGTLQSVSETEIVLEFNHKEIVLRRDQILMAKVDP
jgi:ribosome maturation factor RimP